MYLFPKTLENLLVWLFYQDFENKPNVLPVNSKVSSKNAYLKLKCEFRVILLLFGNFNLF